MEISYTELAQRHVELWRKSGDTASQRKISQLLSDILKHPETGLGKPEQLKGVLSGRWSRRINQKDRIIYRIDKENDTVLVYSLKGHYNL